MYSMNHLSETISLSFTGFFFLEGGGVNDNNWIFIINLHAVVIGIIGSDSFFNNFTV